MPSQLPPTGTVELLDLLAEYVPDDFIDHLLPDRPTGGRRCALSAPQLWRTHLLALLTSTHSVNLVLRQLPEQPGWRRFCRLRRHWPSARMMNEFRERIGVGGLRQINEYLVGRLLRRQGRQPTAVALIDATDLPAACSGFKKKILAPTPPTAPRSGAARSRRVRAVGSSATRSTRFDFGCRRFIRRSPWCRWPPGLRRPM